MKEEENNHRSYAPAVLKMPTKKENYWEKVSCCIWFEVDFFVFILLDGTRIKISPDIPKTKSLPVDLF